MNFHIVEDGGYVEYIREGECNMCGECCCKNFIGAKASAIIGSGPKDDDDKEPDWDAWEGYSNFIAQGLNWWIRFNIGDEMRENPCSSFTDGKCTCWKSDDWLALCRYFPVHPRDLEKFPECGFSFRKVEDDGENGSIS